MSDVLSMQDEQTDNPGEEKGSWVSVAFCHKSYRSVALCIAK